MPNFFRSREGAVPDDDVKTQLTTLGSQSSPGPLLVPGGATFLRAAYVSVVTSNEAADGYAALIRLEGPGIDRGTFTFAAGAGGTAVATGSSSTHPSVRLPINIAVQEAQEILIHAEMLGGDMGTSEVGVTLEFGDSAGPEGESKGEVTVEGEITAVDTLTRFTTQGSVTTPSRLTPPDATLLKRVIYAVASDDAADGEVTFLLRLSGDAIKGGEQVIVLGSESWIDVATGGDGTNLHMVPQILENLDLEITPNETLDISLEMAGVDVGTATGVVTAIFQ
ncbi:MAG: hypothetical protein ACE5HI_06675 [bacterium]